MRKTPIALVALLLGGPSAVAAPNKIENGHYKIDPSHTFAHFAIGHMGLSTLRGRMDSTGGTVVIARGKNHSKVSVTFNPASVDTGNKARDAHLRDMKKFFDVKKYPKITFVSTKVTFDRDDPQEATVAGRLTMHGVTRPVTLDVDDIACKANPLEKKKYTCGFNAQTQLKRSDYGMTAYSALVGDKVELDIDAEASKPANAG